MTTTDNPHARLHFGVFYPGVGGAVWDDPAFDDHTQFETFVRVIRTAERGLFTAFFFGEGLRLREHLGSFLDIDIAGRPDSQTHLAALASITHRIGLVATQNATYHEPHDLAKRLATLDLLSDGRAAWNVVTTDNAWTGENFRRGGYLAHEDRYTHAADTVAAVKAIWQGRIDRRGEPTRVRNGSYRLDAELHLSPSPQGSPVIFQAGASDEGRQLAAQHADVIYSRFTQLEPALEFAADIRRRTLAAGRPADAVKILAGARIVVGDTDADADEKAAWLLQRSWTDRKVLTYLERVWGTSLADYSPDGPLPEIEPVIEAISVTGGNTALKKDDPRSIVARWRALAAERGFTIRQLVLHLNTERAITGSVSRVADHLTRHIREGAVHGFNIGLNQVPTGLDDIVNLIVPALQDRGVYPTAYQGDTLRGNLASDLRAAA